MRGLMEMVFASCMMAAPDTGVRIVRIEEEEDYHEDPSSPDDFGLRERVSRSSPRRTDRLPGRTIARTQTREQARRLRQQAAREAKRARLGLTG